MGNDDISIKEFWNALVKIRYLAAIVLAFALLGATVIVVFKEASYKSEAVISLGYLDRTSPIERPSAIVDSLSDGVISARLRGHHLEIKSISTSPDIAYNYLQLKIDELLKRHKNIAAGIEYDRNRYLDSLRSKIIDVSAAIDMLEAYPSLVGTKEKLYAEIEKTKLLERLAILEKHEKDFSESILRLGPASETFVLQPAALPDRPYSPDPKMYYLYAVFLSVLFILGISFLHIIFCGPT